MDRNHTNYEGLHQGLDVLCRDIDDTMIITYLCVNSTARNELGLKPLTYEYMGDYAEDVKDITTVPLADLLEYNLKDCLATAWLYKKNYPRMIKEKQLQVYEMVKQPDIESICHTEMTGMCLDIDEVKKANKELSEFKEATLTTLYTNQLVIDFNKVLRKTAWEKDFADRKAKAKKPENIKPKELNRFDELIFNPNSGKQVATLLHEVLNLPVLSTTDKGAPSTGNKVLKKLLKDANEELSELLNCLIDITDVSIILNNFLKAMLYDSVLHEDGYYYLHGNFKTTGTVSGRLSSSNVNLQNLPSHSKYSKVIKKCFIAPKGWIFSGADSNSLEDMISALVTKDPNKLKVYTDHYDGHALRSHSYFPDEMPDITKALIEADDEILGNFYEVTLDDGTKQYLRENSKEFKQYKQGD
jgi:DNA polymerase-1